MTVAGVRRDHRDADLGPAVQVLVPGLGRADRERAPQLGDDRPDHGALLLQRADVAEQEVKDSVPTYTSHLRTPV